MVLDMAKVKLITQEGYGTEHNPMVSGSEKVITLDTRLAPNEHICAVVMYDFDEVYDEQLKEKTQRGNDEINPVIAYERINGLVARLLKHVDAAFSDLEQRKAMRDLIMEEAWSWYHVQVGDTLIEAWRKDKYPNYDKAFDVIDEKREVK